MPEASQAKRSIARNASFFRDHHSRYGANVQELDTYTTIRARLTEELRGIERLLDIGNGGVFDYDVSVVSSVVALDLFFDDLPDSFSCPNNVTLKAGSALDIPEPAESFDGVVMVMLLHHLVGKTIRDSLRNPRRALQQAWRVLKPGGRFIIVESCVPGWFYRLEQPVFRLTAPWIERLTSHPATLQFPPALIAQMFEEETGARVKMAPIPKSRWVLQYGFKYPAALTPVMPYLFSAAKPGAVGV